MTRTAGPCGPAAGGAVCDTPPTDKPGPSQWSVTALVPCAPVVIDSLRLKAPRIGRMHSAQ